MFAADVGITVNWRRSLWWFPSSLTSARTGLCRGCRAAWRCRSLCCSCCFPTRWWCSRHPSGLRTPAPPCPTGRRRGSSSPAHKHTHKPDHRLFTKKDLFRFIMLVSCRVWGDGLHMCMTWICSWNWNNKSVYRATRPVKLHVTGKQDFRIKALLWKLTFQSKGLCWIWHMLTEKQTSGPKWSSHLMGTSGWITFLD